MEPKRRTRASRMGFSTSSMGQISAAACFLLVLVIAFAASNERAQGAALAIEEPLRVENRKQKDSSSNKEAEMINFLENVDKYYSQLSRPRFGRSEYKQQPLAFSRLAANADWSRPMPSRSFIDDAGLESAARINSLNELIRRRLLEQVAANEAALY